MMTKSLFLPTALLLICLCAPVHADGMKAEGATPAPSPRLEALRGALATLGLIAPPAASQPRRMGNCRSHGPIDAAELTRPLMS